MAHPVHSSQLYIAGALCNNQSSWTSWMRFKSTENAEVQIVQHGTVQHRFRENHEVGLYKWRINFRTLCFCRCEQLKNHDRCAASRCTRKMWRIIWHLETAHTHTCIGGKIERQIEMQKKRRKMPRDEQTSFFSQPSIEIYQFNAIGSIFCVLQNWIRLFTDWIESNQIVSNENVQVCKTSHLIG